MKIKLFKTRDGSSTLYVPDLNEYYHSIHGAIQESMHVFINAGLKQFTQEQLSIFEMGFGTGLNCILSYLYSDAQHINYTAIEKYPLASTIIDSLAYTEKLNLNNTQTEFFRQIHEVPWNESIILNKKLKLTKIKEDIKRYKHQDSYDLIYFDAFAPFAQPDLWTTDVFSVLYSQLHKNGILVTYCAKGEVRRNMQKVGFNVERLPGPPGKREMLRAKKI